MYSIRNIRLESVIAIVLIGATLLIPMFVMADTEPNDSFDDAELILAGSYTGTLTWLLDDKDYYKVSLGVGDLINVIITAPTDGSVSGQLYNANREEITFRFCFAVDGEVDSTGEYQTKVNQIVFIKLEGSGGTYGMTVEVTPSPDTEPNDSFEEAELMTVGSHTGRLVLTYDDEDYYKISLDVGDTINLTVTAPMDGSLTSQLFNSNKESLLLTFCWVTDGEIDSTKYQTPISQTMYIKLSGYGGNYNINVQVTPNQAPSAVTLETPDELDITDTMISLAWSTCEDDDFDSYEIYRSTSQGTLGTLVNTSTSQYWELYIDTGLSSDTTYYYTIRTYDEFGLYTDSNQVSVTTTKIGEEVGQALGLMCIVGIVVVVIIVLLIVVVIVVLLKKKKPESPQPPQV